MRLQQHTKFGFAMAGLLLAVLAGTRVHATGHLFEEVSNDAGLFHVGESWGASWGDVNGDGWPDLWVNHHFKEHGLYLNKTDGTFEDIATNVSFADMHGGAWGDFDNDGDQDFLQTAGAGATTAEFANQLLVNYGGELVDEAEARGLALPLARGRTPLWLDWDLDGKLDVLIANVERTDGQFPTTLYSQRDGAFVDENKLTGFAADGDAVFATMTGQVAQDPPIILAGASRAYRYDQLPFQDVRSQLDLDNLGPVSDFAVGDFDGDLRPDIFIARRETGLSDVAQLTGATARVRLVSSGEALSIAWRTSGDITISVNPPFSVKLEDIYLGADGRHPESLTFTLSDTNPDNIGWVIPSGEQTLSIGHEKDTPVWRLLFRGAEFVIPVDLSITGTEALHDVRTSGFTPDDGAETDLLLVRKDQSFDDVSLAAGLGQPTSCIAAGAGDFDNDMDLDVYLVCTRMTSNTPNLLLENQGDGTFVPLANAGGAEGPTTALFAGRGESVAIADYDRDGFLDLFVMNGLDFGPLSFGVNQLFHNRGNSNHWIEVDLEGVFSNRDGIGARAFVNAGGALQLRERAGGMHRYSQDHARLHFGLGSHTRIDSLMVEWPSGIRQEIQDLAVDQVVQVVERKPNPPGLKGKPDYTAGVDRGVFLWQSVWTGAFKLRISGDGNASAFSVRLLATRPLEILRVTGLAPADEFSALSNGFVLDVSADASEVGVDFEVDAQTKVLLSVERDGVRDPRDIHVGASGSPLSPSGWILPPGGLPVAPPFTAGADLGLFVGQDTENSPITLRFSNDGQAHRAELILLASQAPLELSHVALEKSASLVTSPFSALMSTSTEGTVQELDVTSQPGSFIGITYEQDDLFQSHSVNPHSLDLGLANAYLFSVE